MKPKTKFLKWYNDLSNKGKVNLVFNPYSDNPMSMNVCAMEIKFNTALGESILKELGYC